MNRCLRCGAEEFRIHGYCSIRCEELHELEIENKISELLIDDRYGVYEIEYVKQLRGLLNETLMFLGTIDVVLTYDEVMKACKHFRLRIEKSLKELEK